MYLHSSMITLYYYRNNDDSIVDRTPKRLRRKQFVGDLTEEDFMTPRRRKRSLHIVRTYLEKAKLRIKALNDRNSALSKRNRILNTMLQKLKEKRLLSVESSKMIQVNQDFYYKRQYFFLSKKCDIDAIYKLSYLN